MRSTLNRKLFGIALLSVSTLAFGGDEQEHRAQFVGLLAGQVVGVQADAQRCPNPAHPLRIDVSGTAQTILGKAQYTQTHCEDTAHTVVTLGVLSMSFADGSMLFSAYHANIFATPTTATDNRLVARGQYHDTSGTGALSKMRGRGAYAGMVDISTFAVVVALDETP